MLRDYIRMSRVELEDELKRLNDNLEDLEETFQFHLKNTSDHISGRIVAKGEEEIEKLKLEIDRLKKVLSKR